MRASTPFAIRQKMFMEIPKGRKEVLNLLIPRLKTEPLKKLLAEG